MGIQEEIQENYLSTIIFSSLAIEAYIFDYAARNLGDSFVSVYIDKFP